MDSPTSPIVLISRVRKPYCIHWFLSIFIAFLIVHGWVHRPQSVLIRGSPLCLIVSRVLCLIVSREYPREKFSQINKFYKHDSSLSFCDSMGDLDRGNIDVHPIFLNIGPYNQESRKMSIILRFSTSFYWLEKTLSSDLKILVVSIEIHDEVSEFP